MAAATPANSATTFARSTKKPVIITKKVGRNPNSSRMRSESPFPVTTPIRAHLFRDIEGNGHGDERPEEGVAILRAGLGVNGDAPRVVIHIGRYQARSDDGQEQGQPTPQAADALLQIRAAALQPLN